MMWSLVVVVEEVDMGSPKVERRLTLPPLPESPGIARRLLREVLQECGRSHLLDSAELALSELATNVVLHAHTELVVTVRCTEDELRVEVQDSSPVMIPAQRVSGEVSPTGRGMALVAAVSKEHGVIATATGGKIVWFTMTDEPEPEPDVEALLAAWDDEVLSVTPPEGESRAVTLLGFPPTLWLAAISQHDAQLRELALLHGSQGDAAEALAAADRARFAVRAAMERALALAREAGIARVPLPQGHPAPLEAVPAVVDLDVGVDEHSAADFASLQDLLDEAQRLAYAGQMLTPAALPEIVAVRDWACEQVVTLLAGEVARPWPGADSEHFAQAVDHAARQIDFDVERVMGDQRTGIVVDAHNRIVAISDRLAEAVGWSVDELVGRRVVALIPPRFREAHTAGFTRHLTTGEAHALEVDLELPVLRKDGTEAPYGFYIQADRTRSGQPVYIAWLTAR